MKQHKRRLLLRFLVLLLRLLVLPSLLVLLQCNTSYLLLLQTLLPFFLLLLRCHTGCLSLLLLLQFACPVIQAVGPFPNHKPFRS
jgi:hypothetical protein